ncbi:hypothetical protein SteCoe_35552 [Stentor coeruleus]|uniref:Leucine-rich repeat-containing protein n=1 Tax=Stentor coeruleus TaxID=5963 RepID=A0A1R2AS56_9CILI|nr:hypothetical protein SteCoe_35552 [Stentor coeruleus]
MESVYTEACTSKEVIPQSQVLSFLKTQSPSLIIDSSTQSLSDNDFFSICILLSNSPSHLKDLSITGEPISEISLQYLSDGLDSNQTLSKISLTKLSLRHSKSFILLIISLQKCPNLESLDLSYNLLDDNTGPYISKLINSDKAPFLTFLNLDHNQISNFSFASSLNKNKSLLDFSVNSNPLEYMNFVSLLEMLTVNKTLQHLGVKGMIFKGPAPIKENPSGLLTIQEAVTLKLANVLRYSYICSISIDLDPNTDLQLKELENTIIKHNRMLMKIESPFIDWENVTGPLLGILKGLKANKWFSEGSHPVPKDLEDIINIKKTYKSSSQTSLEDKKTPKKIQKKDTIKRTNSSDSRNSETTTLNNSKLVREMSFGKASLSKYINEEDTLMIYLQTMNDRIVGMEEKISNYTNKTDLLLEKIDARAGRKNCEEMPGVCKILGDIQERLDKFEKDKICQNEIIEGYIQKLEAFKPSKDPLEQSRKSLRHTRPLNPEKLENSSFEAQEIMTSEGTGRSSKSSKTKDRISRLEQRIERIEQNSLDLGKVKQDLKGTIEKVINLESMMSSIKETPKKYIKERIWDTEKRLDGFGILPGESESIVMNALLEKAHYARINNSLSRPKSQLSSSKDTRRTPSTELKPSLRSKDLSVKKDRYFYRLKYP